MIWAKLCDPVNKPNARLNTNKRHISQIMSSLLAALMLLVAVAGKSWSVAPDSDVKGKTEQTADKTADDSATLSELSLHAVVTPALSFDFEKALFVLPFLFQYSTQEKVAVPLACRIPFYYFSYFQYIFGHHIAPNAP